MDPEVLSEAFRDFFRDRLTEFSGYGSNGKHGQIFFQIFPDKQLSIMVETPVVTKSNGQLRLKTAKAVRLSLKVTQKETLFEIVDTHLSHDWRYVLEKKIMALVDLVEEIEKCRNCGCYMIPRLHVKKQNHHPGTKFIWPECPHCRKRCSTTYGIGLKTRLHPLLK